MLIIKREGFIIEKSYWTFITNHGRVFVFIAKNPRTTTRIIAQEVEVTERTVQNIITDLEKEGYIVKHREGRNNYYEIHPEIPMRHPMDKEHLVSSLLVALGCTLEKGNSVVDNS